MTLRKKLKNIKKLTTVEFIRSIRTLIVSIALEISGDATSISTLKLFRSAFCFKLIRR